MRLLNVEKRISEESRDGADRGRRAADVEDLRPGIGSRCVLGDAHEQQVDEWHRGEGDRDGECPPHAHQSDREARQRARHDEGDALHGPHEAVGIRVALGRDEQGHRRRQGDVAQILDDGAGQDDAREQPEPRSAEVEDRRLGLRHVDRAGREERDEGEHPREDHDGVLAEAVDERAEDHAEDRQQQHVGAADDARGEHRLGLEVHPEGEREPQEARRDVRDGRVHQDVQERAHPARRDGARRRRRFTHAVRVSPGSDTGKSTSARPRLKR